MICSLLLCTVSLAVSLHQEQLQPTTFGESEKRQPKTWAEVEEQRLKGLKGKSQIHLAKAYLNAKPYQNQSLVQAANKNGSFPEEAGKKDDSGNEAWIDANSPREWAKGEDPPPNQRQLFEKTTDDGIGFGKFWASNSKDNHKWWGFRRQKLNWTNEEERKAVRLENTGPLLEWWKNAQQNTSACIGLKKKECCTRLNREGGDPCSWCQLPCKDKCIFWTNETAKAEDGFCADTCSASSSFTKKVQMVCPVRLEKDVNHTHFLPQCECAANAPVFYSDFYCPKPCTKTAEDIPEYLRNEWNSYCSVRPAEGMLNVCRDEQKLGYIPKIPDRP